MCKLNNRFALCTWQTLRKTKSQNSCA